MKKKDNLGELGYIENMWQILLSMLMYGDKPLWVSFWPLELDMFFVHALDPLSRLLAPSLSCLLAHAEPLVSIASFPARRPQLSFPPGQLPILLADLTPFPPVCGFCRSARTGLTWTSSVLVLSSLSASPPPTSCRLVLADSYLVPKFVN